MYEWVEKLDLKQSIDQLVSDTQYWLNELTDSDVIELLMTGFIPEVYEENRKKEKIFTKLMEVLIVEVLSRIGFSSIVVKSKNESEDGRIEINHQVILVDVKSFRLGRSQIAPNVKDFVKLNTVENWLNNYNQTHQSKAIGSLIVYPSTHEWIKHSQVYKECSNKRVPIVMLSYEMIAFLLEYKTSYKTEDLLLLWNYDKLFPETVSTRQQYWSVIYQYISEITSIPEEKMKDELEVLRLYYEEVIKETKDNLALMIDDVSRKIPQKISNMSEKEAKTLLIETLIQSEITPFKKTISNIDKNRKLFLFS